MKPGQADKCIEAMKALYGPPMTDEQQAEYDRQRAAVMQRDMAARGQRATFRDLLEFALAYGIDGTPKYRREAIRCLESALHLLRGDPA